MSSESVQLYSHYLFVLNKFGVCPILDLRPLNHALEKRAFKMLTVKQILEHVQPGNYFIVIDLKDAYFHI